jgi:hypothetical protein
MAKAIGHNYIAELADVLDSRIHSHLNWSEIDSEESYFRAVKNFLAIEKAGDPVPDRGRHLSNFFARDRDVAHGVYKRSGAEDRVEEKLKLVKEKFERVRLLRKAQVFERRRPARSRIPDERRTAKNVRPIDQRNFNAWRRNPNRSDLRSIDTRRIKRISTRNLITQGDLRLRHIKPVIDSRGIKSYRNNEGKFIKNPFRRTPPRYKH